MRKDIFTRVLKDHRNRIYSHALRCLRDPDDAADVTQEAFLRLWRRGPDIEEDRLAAWLTRVTHNLCIDHARRTRTVHTYFGTPDIEAANSLAAAPEPESFPETDQQRALLDALETLPPETRSILLMHYFQGLKLREIASTLDMNLNSVKVRVHRARKTLRLILDDVSGTPSTAKWMTG